MGVTIFYSGKIKDIDRIPELITEFKDICEVMQWEYSIYDESFDEPASLTHKVVDGNTIVDGNAGLKGISFAPHPQCESINLVFNRDRQLSSIISVLLDTVENGLFTKTQFAGIDIHIRAVDLLEYAAAKYFDEFEIDDDCGYVEHRDRERSLKSFQIIEDGINMIADAINSIDKSKIDLDDGEALFKAIEERIKLFMKGRKG